VDIRTKLVFALVAVSLAGMFALGAVVSPRVEGYIRDGTLQRLEQAADSKSRSLSWVIAGWRDRTDLVASRTQLRARLEDHDRTGDPAAAAAIQAILEDAMSASRWTTLLGVYDTDGRTVASVRRGIPRAAVEDGSVPETPPPGPASYAGIVVSGDGPPQVTFLALMEHEGRPVGTLLSVFEAPELLELTRSYEGLGESGETLILTGDDTGTIRTLHPTRHEAGQDGSVAVRPGPGSLGSIALSGLGTAIEGGVVDYRGEEVWAAVQPVQEMGLGLVVKLDRAEGMQPAVEFNRWLRRTAVILSAFAIVVGLVLALRFALPIHALAEVADRIRHGEMQARANAEREDEVGLLARTFNDMADELEQRMGELHEYRRFFDVTIDLMCIAGTDGYFRKTNPAFERELGWSAEELESRPFVDFIHPDDVEKTVREVAKLAEGIPTVSFENRYQCKDGSYKLLRWTSYPEGDVLYAIAHILEPSSSAAES